MRSHTFLRRIDWGETDAAGIVYYPNYFNWFVHGTHELFRDVGYSVSVLMKDGVLLPILSVGSDFKTALYYDDEILVVSEVQEIKTRSIRIGHTVYRGDDITGIGFEWRGWVVKSEDKLQAVSIPDEVKVRLSKE